MEPPKVQEKNKSATLKQPPKPTIPKWIKLKSRTHHGLPFFVNKNTGTSVWKLEDVKMLNLKKMESNAFPNYRERKLSVAKEKLLKRQFTNKEISISKKIEQNKMHDIRETKDAVAQTNSDSIKIQAICGPKQDAAETIELPETRTTNDFHLKRQFTNDRIQNPMPHTFTQMGLVPPYPPPQITVPNYAPPPLLPQVITYPQILPCYPQQQIIPNYTVPKANTCIPSVNTPYATRTPVQTTFVSISSRFEKMAAESEMDKKTICNDAAQFIVNNAPPGYEIQRNASVARPLNNKYCTKPSPHKLINRNPLRRPQRYLRNAGIKDLREKLRVKRSRMSNFQAEDESPHNHASQREIKNPMTHLNVDDSTNDDIASSNSGWIQRTAAGRNRLKLLLGCRDEDYWYVLPDTNVLLSNCYFLKMFVHSDANCRILLSSRVLTELQYQMKKRNSQAAAAALQYLDSSPRVTTDKMLFAKLKVTVQIVSGDDEIMDCLLRLRQHNFPVLLISNDKVLLCKAITSKVSAYSVSELKECLFSSKIAEGHGDFEKNLLIRFNCFPFGANETLPVASNNSIDFTSKSTEIQVSPLQNISDSDAQKDLILKQIQIEIPNTKSYVDRDVQTIEDYVTDDCSNTESTLELTTNLNVETATDPKEENRKNRRSKLWSRRRQKIKTSNTASTLTDSVELTTSNDMQTKEQTLLNSPKNITNQFNIAQEHSNDSNDSFSLSKRFSGSYLISDSSQLQPRTVEESLTNSSDVISNTRSSVSSVNNVIDSLENNFDGEIDGVLFDVSDSAMEARLKTGYEEWQSRFLQIMEEVLTQVLRQNPLPNNPYEPPWTIHEATVCLKEKYYNNSAIVNAATRFSFTIYASSNKMGEIFRTFCPKRFMKLFSHGWALVFVLHQVLSGRPGSEDLELAKESLTKLLNDIKGDSDTIDNFVDDSAEECLQDVDMDTFHSEHRGSQGDMFQQYESPQISSPILQNRNKDPFLTQASSNYAKVNRQINNAGLIQLINNHNSMNELDQEESTLNMYKTTTPDYSAPEEIRKFPEDTILSPKTPDTTSPINQCKIVRKFTKNVEFERRLLVNNDTLGVMPTTTSPGKTKNSHNNEKIKRNLQKFAEFERKLLNDTDNYDKNMSSSTANKNPVRNKKLIFAALEESSNQSDKLDQNKGSSATTLITDKNPVIKRSLNSMPEFERKLKRKDNDKYEKNKLASTTISTTNNSMMNRNLINLLETETNIVRKDKDNSGENKHSSITTSTANENLVMKRKQISEFEKRLLRKDDYKLDKNKHTSTTSPTTIEKPVMNRNLKFAEIDEKRVTRKESENFSVKKHPPITTSTNINPVIKRNVIKIAEYEKRIISKNNDKLDMNKNSSTATSNLVINRDLKKIPELDKRIIRKGDTLDRVIPGKAPIGRSTQAACLISAQSHVDMDMLSYSEDECEDKEDFEDDKHNNYGIMDDGGKNLLKARDEYKDEEKPKVTIKAFLAEIKDTFLHVHSYCEQTYLELNTDKIIDSERKVELKEQTEDMQAFLNSLLSTLNSILLRENNSEVNIQKSRFPTLKLGDSQCSTYSVIIEKCCAQAKILLDVLSSIIRDILS